MDNTALDLNLYDDRIEIWREVSDWDLIAIDVTKTVNKDDFEPICIDLSEVKIEVDEAGEMTGFSHDEDLPRVAEEVFVVGFPQGIDMLGPDAFPIWKRASIASEPHIRVSDDPVFLVDTLGRSGLSGSPVLSRAPTLVSPWGFERTRRSDEPEFRLVGVYVGREGANNMNDISFGRVYKLSAVQDTILARKSAD